MQAQPCPPGVRGSQADGSSGTALAAVCWQRALSEGLLPRAHRASLTGVLWGQQGCPPARTSPLSLGTVISMDSLRSADSTALATPGRTSR